MHIVHKIKYPIFVCVHTDSCVFVHNQYKGQSKSEDKRAKNTLKIQQQYLEKRK